MTEEFNLSEKIIGDEAGECRVRVFNEEKGIYEYHQVIFIEDVKEFIRRLKEELNKKPIEVNLEEMNIGDSSIDYVIDKLSGSDLI